MMDAMTIAFLLIATSILILFLIERSILALCDLIIELCETSAFLKRTLMWNPEREEAKIQAFINRRMQREFQ